MDADAADVVALAKRTPVTTPGVDPGNTTRREAEAAP